MTFCLFAVASLAQTPATRGGEPPATDEGPSPQPAIQLSDDRSQIVIVGIPAPTIASLRSAKMDARTWPQVLRVTVGSDRGNSAAATPLMGRFDLDDDSVTFTPRFPLRPGLTYRVIFDLSRRKDIVDVALPAIEAMIALPRRLATAAAKVKAVYPSVDELPANQLKFYIHFSAPMSRGDDYRHVHIVDADGQIVPDAFLELPEELWDASGLRLTLLFDPGRIKRGLKPNEDVGAPLVRGQSYALVISSGWRDANGEPLAKEFRKEFRVVEADDKQPNPAAWKVTPPIARSRDPLTVVVNEPLDHALLERSLEVVNSERRPVNGDVTIDEQETRWQFRPTAIWQPGGYRIVIDPTLEDLAGNSIGRAFETHDPNAPIGKSVDEPVVLPFAITP